MKNAHDMLIDWAGDDAELSTDQADAMFDAVFTASEDTTSEDTGASSIATVIPLWPRRLALVATLTLALAGALYLGRPPEQPYRGVKSQAGAIPLRVELMAFAAKPGPDPQIDRALATGASINPGESIVFRYVLAQPARLVLVATRPEPEVLWDSGQILGAGEREIADAGLALAMNPAPYAPRLELTLVAIPPEAHALKSAQDALTACTGCGHATLELEVGR